MLLLLLLLLLRSPAISLGFTILGEIFANLTVFLSNHWDSHIPSSWMVNAGCVFVARIHPSRTWMSGSFGSVHQKEFWGNGVRTHVNSKGKIPFKGKIPSTGKKKNLLREGSNSRRCIKQESEPNALPTSYSTHSPSQPSTILYVLFVG